MPWGSGDILSECLLQWNIRRVYGIVGIPVTSLALDIQKKNVDFIATRNEAAAGYSAGTEALLSAHPAVVLITGGPGLINGLAGLAHATVNRLPVITIAGAPALSDIGTGCFQDLDALKLPTGEICKNIFRAESLDEIPDKFHLAVQTAYTPPYGGSLLILPTCVIFANPLNSRPASLDRCGEQKCPRSLCRPTDENVLSQVVSILEQARKALVIIGKGVHQSKAEMAVLSFVEKFNLPFLTSPQGRGIIPDEHRLCVSAARSFALQAADVALVLGARINWMFGHGCSPPWSQTVRFVIVDVAPTENPRGVSLQGDVKSVLDRLLEHSVEELGGERRSWVNEVTSLAAERKGRSPENSGNQLTYVASMRAISEMVGEYSKKKIVIIADGSKTLDVSRSTVAVPYRRIDCGTWGTMGTAIPSVLAASLQGFATVAVVGDSAIGFSLAELETLVRYRCSDAVIFVFNNGGIYAGEATPQWPPLPTELSQQTRYDRVMEAVGGQGFWARDMPELRCILQQLQAGRKGPVLVNLLIEPKDLGNDLIGSNFARRHQRQN